MCLMHFMPIVNFFLFLSFLVWTGLAVFGFPIGFGQPGRAFDYFYFPLCFAMTILILGIVCNLIKLKRFDWIRPLFLHIATILAIGYAFHYFVAAYAD